MQSRNWIDQYTSFFLIYYSNLLSAEIRVSCNTRLPDNATKCRMLWQWKWKVREGEDVIHVKGSHHQRNSPLQRDTQPTIGSIFMTGRWSPSPLQRGWGAGPGGLAGGWHAVLIQAVGGSSSYWVVGTLWWWAVLTAVVANTWSGPMWATWLKDIGAEISRDLLSGLQKHTDPQR